MVSLLVLRELSSDVCMYWHMLDLCCQCDIACVVRTAFPCSLYVLAVFRPSIDWSTVSDRPVTKGLAKATLWILALALLSTCWAPGMSPTWARRLACPNESATSQRTLCTSISWKEGELTGVAQALSRTRRHVTCCCVCLQLSTSK